MEEITFKRLLRWTLASLMVVIAIAYGFGVGIASAESGNISFVSDNQTTSVLGGGSAVVSGETEYLEEIEFYNATYDSISEINFSSTEGLNIIDSSSTESDYSTFTFVSGNTSPGIGVISFSKSKGYIKYVFPEAVKLNSHRIKINITKQSFKDNVTILMHESTAPTCASIDYPVCLVKNADTNNYFNFYKSGILYYHVQAYSSLGSSTYLDYEVSYPSYAVGYFIINVTKYPLSTNTLTSVQSATHIYQNETGTYNDNSYSYFGQYLDGLYLLTLTQSGEYRLTTINSSGLPAPAPTPTINPITGAGIIFDQSDYALGDIANITWSRTISTPFGDTDFIVIIYPDGTEEELISSPPDSGNYKVLMSPAGTWKVEFRRSSLLFGVSVLDSDTATVGAETPSYIYAPVNVAMGKLFTVTYKIGFTQTATAWIKTYRWMGSDWVYEQAFAATGAKNIETNISILIKDKGKYLIKLCDVLLGCKASTSTTGYFNGTETTLNVTVSNITTDKAAYSYGEYITTNVYVDNANWTNKAILVDYLNYDTGITHNQQYIQSQVESFNLYVSDLVFPASGNSALRLIGKNDTGTYVLAYKNFTLSSLDAEGYGLSILGNPTCKGGTGQIKVVVPGGEVANLSISADNAIYNKEYVMNGSKIVPYTFSISGAYYVTLRVNGEAKRLIIVNIGDCTIPINTTWQGQGKIDNACSFWDGWVMNMAGGQGLNDLTRFEFALLVIGMITAFTAIITKNLGAGIITGFFPYSFFVFLSMSTPCGQYMPVWTAVFIALIVGIKMKWFN